MSDDSSLNKDSSLSLQERFFPAGTCFGCGPANPRGLRIRSFPSATDAEILVCDWVPEEHHAAYGTFLNGGVIGALFDCHCNWAATWHLMQGDEGEAPPCTVTADFQVKFKRPTSMTGPIHMEARVVSAKGSKVEVDAIMTSGGKRTATCRGTFVAVKPDHPAYHRW